MFAGPRDYVCRSQQLGKTLAAIPLSRLWQKKPEVFADVLGEMQFGGGVAAGVWIEVGGLRRVGWSCDRSRLIITRRIFLYSFKPEGFIVKKPSEVLNPLSLI